MMDATKFISVYASRSILQEIAIPLARACRRLDCDFVFYPDTPLDGASVLIAFVEENEITQQLDSLSSEAASHSIPFLSLNENLQQSETAIYEILLPFVNDREPVINGLLRIDLHPEKIDTKDVFVTGGTVKESIQKEKKPKTQLFINLSVILGALLIAVAVFFVLVIRSLVEEHESRLSDLQYAVEDGQEQIDNLRTALEEKDKSIKTKDNLFASLGEYQALIIKNVEVANIQKNGDIINDFGTTIYSSGARFIKSRVEYYGLKPGDITLNIKLYNYSRSVDMSFSRDVRISEGARSVNLLGQGWENSGNFTAGSYHYEIWLDNRMLYDKTFEIK